jgi:hypothetical protein
MYVQYPYNTGIYTAMVLVLRATGILIISRLYIAHTFHLDVNAEAVLLSSREGRP